MSDLEIYDMDETDLSTHLVGKSIRSISGNTIELTDGTVLEVEDAADCCAWFSGDVKAFDFTDNVITGVTRKDVDAAEEYDEAWTLQVFSAHKIIAEVNIEGNASSGYYCHSVGLRVKAPNEQGNN